MYVQTTGCPCLSFRPGSIARTVWFSNRTKSIIKTKTHHTGPLCTLLDVRPEEALGGGADRTVWETFLAQLRARERRAGRWGPILLAESAPVF